MIIANQGMRGGSSRGCSAQARRQCRSSSPAEVHEDHRKVVKRASSSTNDDKRTAAAGAGGSVSEFASGEMQEAQKLDAGTEPGFPGCRYRHR